MGEEVNVGTVAIAIMCKTPAAGVSKTRLSPPLRAEECAMLSRCFIRDLSQTIASLTADGDVCSYAIYTPIGSESALQQLLPPGFRLLAQGEGDLGQRLFKSVGDLLDRGHCGAILVNSDSPTLPREVLRAAVDAVRSGDNITLSPAHDGGYTLIGMSALHERIFLDIPWSTDAVYRLTVERAQALGLPVVNVPGWYDVDDARSLRMLADELFGTRPPFAAHDIRGAAAPATRRFMQQRQAAPVAS